MNNLDNLDTLTLPLNQASLIEASAGTGKTYTMANLYLRLILGVECDQPLSVDQILVVTFTKAATQELRDRIRAKLAKVAKWFEDIDNQILRKELDVDGDESQFLLKLYDNVKDNLETAKLRLKIAERDMDLASIFTIDSFCQKMLFQYAFDSGMRFDIDLQPDESELLARLSEETWRELFYSEDKDYIGLVKHFLKTPKNALQQVKGYLTGDLVPLRDNQKEFLDIKKFLLNRKKSINEIKQFWKENSEEMISLILNDFELDKKNTFQPKTLNGKSYNKQSLENTEIPSISSWANSESYLFPSAWKNKDDVDKKFWVKFTQSYINEKTKGKNQPISSPLFKQADDLFLKLKVLFHTEKRIGECLIFHFFTNLRNKLYHYKQIHKEKSFNDITDFLHSSLMGNNGEQFAAAIRGQFRFAMIDEFQDTSRRQYEIFQRIFMHNAENQGFVMIGDPKQSIYKFRNADIFSYLQAAKDVGGENTYGMDKNWRSVPQVVSDINKLFDFEKSFIFDDIQFQDVKAKVPDELLQNESHTNCYLVPEYKLELAAEYCAYHIQQQLKKSENGELFLQKNNEKRPLAEKDITILVRDRFEADAVKKALQRRHIRSIYLSARDSVFSSQEAQDLHWLLAACADPSQQKSLLATLGSALWGKNAAEIFAIKHDEAAWDSLVEQFVAYQKTWPTQGVLPMLHQIFLEQGIIARLNSQENAERRITDLLHLAELLQEAMEEHRSEAALIQWFQQQLDQPNDQADEQKLRLESEQELIKIVTIHGSKGLEYPVVWLPFVAKANQGKINTPAIYHNENGELCWAFEPVSEQEKQSLNREDFAEDLRLLYVAVTRAKHQLNLVAPEQFKGSWNSLAYLLSNGEIGIDKAEIKDSTKTLIDNKKLDCEVIEYQEPKTDNWQAQSETSPNLVAQTFTGNIQPTGLITSFSALTQNHHKSSVENSKELDETDDFEPTSELENNEPIQNQFTFPKGKHAGDKLHQFFEHWDFHDIKDEDLSKMLKALNLNEEIWQEPCKTWFEQIAKTPLFDGACLADILPEQSFKEWEFYFRIASDDALAKLNGLLKAENPDLPDLKFQQLEGFMNGKVDLIAQIGGKFYIIDYKSNHLGNREQNYRSEKLAKAMLDNRYDVQYAIYTLALHRYLHSRLGKNYDYDKNFGGIAYLFLRGMNGQTDNGVFFEKPSRELVEKMDKVFSKAID